VKNKRKTKMDIKGTEQKEVFVFFFARSLIEKKSKESCTFPTSLLDDSTHRI
jgi:hypothetical protein